jgi:hypothetical protein
MKRILSLLAAASLIPALGQAQVIVNDSWADGGRNNGADPMDADWWSSSTSSGIEVSVGSLGMVTGGSGRGIHGTFSPQTLAVGQMMRATFTFTTPATVGNNLSSPFRVALTEYREALAANLTASSGAPNAAYIGVPGYMADWDVNKTDTTDDTAIRKHDVAATDGRLLGTTAEWDDLGDGPDDDYAFAANTQYEGIFSVARLSADSVEISAMLSQAGTEMSSFSVIDSTSAVTSFGVLAFWANSNAFGAVNTVNTPNNGIDFSNITIEIVAVPEPSTAAMVFGGMLLLGVSRRMRA